MHDNLHHLFDVGCLETPLTWLRLVERIADDDGTVHEVYEYEGELIVVDSWSADFEIEEVT
jgi:hypothetical protein